MRLIPFKFRCFQSFHATGKQAERLLTARIWHKILRSGKDLYKCTHMHAHIHTHLYIQYNFFKLFFKLQEYRNTQKSLRLWTLSTYLLNKHAFGLKAEFLQALLYTVPYLCRSFWKAEVCKAATVHAAELLFIESVCIFTYEYVHFMCIF